MYATPTITSTKVTKTIVSVPTAPSLLCLRPGVVTQSRPSCLLVGGGGAWEKVERDDNGGESLIRIDAGRVVHIQPAGPRPGGDAGKAPLSSPRHQGHSICYGPALACQHGLESCFLV